MHFHSIKRTIATILASRVENIFIVKTYSVIREFLVRCSIARLIKSLLHIRLKKSCPKSCSSLATVAAEWRLRLDRGSHPLDL
jgi:hypothetical protein